MFTFICHFCYCTCSTYMDKITHLQLRNPRANLPIIVDGG